MNTFSSSIVEIISLATLLAIADNVQSSILPASSS
nr:MAG TPA: hypothetical protein [Bacteriophage sp.]